MIRRWRGLAVTSVALVALSGRPVGASGDGSPRTRDGSAVSTETHDIHLTYSRVVVDGTSVLWRVRLFRDDLEKALAMFAKDPSLKLTSPKADSVFGSYFNREVPVVANGTSLRGEVLQSGKDPDVADQEMWWYVVELTAPAPVKTLSTRVGLLFEHFSDQRNVMTLLKMPESERHSLYFVPSDAKPQTIAF